MFAFFKSPGIGRLLAILGFLALSRFLFVFFGIGITESEWKIWMLGNRLEEGFSMYDELWDDELPIPVLLLRGIGTLVGLTPLSIQITASLVLLLNAFICNYIFISRGVVKGLNFLPAFIFILLGSSIADFTWISSHSLSTTFLMLALHQTHKTLENPNQNSTSLQSGIYTALAGLCHLPSLCFVVVFAMTSYSRRSHTPNVPSYLLGVSIPVLILLADAYWRGKLDFLIFSMWESLAHPDSATPFLSLLILATPLVMACLTGLLLRRSGRGSLEKPGFMGPLMLAYALIVLGMLLFDRPYQASGLHFALPAVTYLFTKGILSTDRQRTGVLSSFLLNMFCLFCLFWPFFIYQSRSDLIPLQLGTTPVGKIKTMQIGDSPWNPLEEQICGPILDKDLGIMYLEKMDRYRYLVTLSEVLDKDLPELIVDPQDRMSSVFHHLPSLRKKYKREGDGRYRLVTSGS